MLVGICDMFVIAVLVVVIVAVFLLLVALVVARGGGGDGRGIVLAVAPLPVPRSPQLLLVAAAVVVLVVVRMVLMARVEGCRWWRGCAGAALALGSGGCSVVVAAVVAVATVACRASARPIEQAVSLPVLCQVAVEIEVRTALTVIIQLPHPVTNVLANCPGQFKAAYGSS